jgi:hypothetical protein
MRCGGSVPSRPRRNHHCCTGAVLRDDVDPLPFLSLCALGGSRRFAVELVDSLSVPSHVGLEFPSLLRRLRPPPIIARYSGPSLFPQSSQASLHLNHSTKGKAISRGLFLQSPAHRKKGEDREGNLLCILGLLVQVRAACKFFLMHRTPPVFAPPSDRLIIGVLDVPKARFWLTLNVSQLDSVSFWGFPLINKLQCISFCNLHRSSYDLIIFSGRNWRNMPSSHLLDSLPSLNIQLLLSRPPCGGSTYILPRSQGRSMPRGKNYFF